MLVMPWFPMVWSTEEGTSVVVVVVVETVADSILFLEAGSVDWLNKPSSRRSLMVVVVNFKGTSEAIVDVV